MPRYEVWVTLEEWDGDNKIEDVVTCLVGTVPDDERGRQLFIPVQEAALAARQRVEGTIDFIK